TDPAIDQAIDEALAQAGFRVVRLNQEAADQWQRATTDAKNLAIADGWLTNRQYLGERGVTSVTKAIIRLGEFEYKNNYPALLRSRAEWQRDLGRMLKQVDYIALPTLQSVPPKIPFWGRSALF